MPNSPYQEMELEYDPFNVEDTRTTTSAERAISQDTFRELLKEANELEPLLDLEMRFFLITAGRLGLRVGEIIHMDKSWVDFKNEWVSIPKHDPCTKGKDGGICGHCRQGAKQMAEVNNISQDNAEKLYWKAKTVRASRDVPYSFHDTAKEVIEGYFNEYDQVIFSGTKANRMTNRITEKAGLDDVDVTPHGLRATAAMYHVETGIDMWALQSLMGWAYPNTARKYILNNSRRTKNLLEERHETSGL